MHARPHNSKTLGLLKTAQCNLPLLTRIWTQFPLKVLTFFNIDLIEPVCLLKSWPSGQSLCSDPVSIGETWPLTLSKHVDRRVGETKSNHPICISLVILYEHTLHTGWTQWHFIHKEKATVLALRISTVHHWSLPFSPYGLQYFSFLQILYRCLSLVIIH